MQFRVLGPLEVLDASGSPLPLAGAKERTLLAALLLDPGEVVSSDRLIDVLWPEAPPANPSNALQARVSALRRSLGSGAAIVNHPPGYRLDVAPASVDAKVFEDLLGQARKAAQAGRPEAIDLYDEALQLWRGEPFADFAYQDFARPEILRLEECWIAAREERIQARLDVGRHAEVLGELERLVSEHPFRERLRAQLMLALYRSGRQAEALRAFGEASRILAEELGIEPSAELRDLEYAILTQDPQLAGPTPEHRPPSHNLPARLTSLIGRSVDIERVTSLLSDHRLVTLTGPGGVGKTSLALACGQETLERFADGVWLVELASISDPDLVPTTIARSLGLDGGDRPTLDLLCEALRERTVLIVVDNCEHLIDAVAHTAAAILRRAPRVVMIATSREPLGVAGEILWPTRPLETPAPVQTPEDLGEVDAVRLFVDRARAVSPDFRLDEQTAPAVADICRRLDGLPLALELAAARVRTLPVGEIAARLDDRFRLLTGTSRTATARQLTLDAAIGWSHDLLTDEEQRLFRRLSVFSGGWTVAAAEAVSPDTEDMLDALARLVDRSLVITDHAGDLPRYSMLETIRAYAARSLTSSGEERATAQRHAAWCLSLAESAHFQGPEQASWAAALSAEHENLRSALAVALGHGEADIALRLGAALGWSWFFGNRDEGRAALDQVLLATTDRTDSARLGALLARARLDLFGPTQRTIDVAEEALVRATTLGDELSAARAKTYLSLGGLTSPSTGHALQLLDDAIATFQAAGDTWEEGLARFQRMEVVARDGDLAGAIEDGEAALSLFRRTRDPWAISAALAHLAKYGRYTGQIARSHVIAGEALAIARERGLPHTVQYVMTHQAYLELLEHDAERALPLLELAMDIAVDIGNQVGVATICNGRAEAFAAMGNLDEARRLHDEAVVQFEALGLAADLGYSRTRLGLVEELSGRWCEAERAHALGLQDAVACGDVLGLVPCLEGLGRVADAGGDFERAAHLLAAGSALRGRTGLVPLPVEAELTTRSEERVAADLGQSRLDAISAKVTAMDRAAVVAIAGAGEALAGASPV